MLRHTTSKAVRIAAAVMAVLITLVSGPSAASEIVGDWSGIINFSGAELRIVFHITAGDDGTLAATMDSPDQGAAGIPVSGVTFDGDSLVIEVAVAQGGYYGRYDRDSLFVDGEWRQAGFKLPLRLVRGGVIKLPARPQEPERPLPYPEEEVEFDNGVAGITLAGTLTMPEGEGPFPAAVLISGSGPQDRDEMVLGHRPFLVLSDHLTRNGIAVLRYDRGIGKSGGVHGTATTADFATDARAAFEYLKTREKIDASLTGLIGHSEGGIIAAMVAADSGDIVFIILLAGPGLKGSEILLAQNITLLELQGASAEVITKRSEQLEQEYQILAEQRSDGETREAIVNVSTSFLEKYSPEEREQYGFNEDGVKKRAEILTGPWFRFFMEYDPSAALRKVRCPVLAMIGSLDMQVDPGRNLPAIENALSEGGNKDYRIVEMPGLNHLFQTSETGSPSEYALIEETMSPAALEMVSGWILSLQTGGK